MLTRMLKKNRNGRDRLKEIHDFEAKPRSCPSAKLFESFGSFPHASLGCSILAVWGFGDRNKEG
jgi:hypothetical protein